MPEKKVVDSRSGPEGLTSGSGSGSVITGHKVSAILRERSRELRKEMTAAERILWSHLRRNALSESHFRRQQIIGGFIVDFYCASARLIVEVDGPIHDTQVERDRDREAILAGYGARILRFTNEQIETKLGDVLAAIQGALADRRQ